jgi:hypothetical protein
MRRLSLKASADDLIRRSGHSIEKILEFFFEWNDVLDIEVHPAVSAEEGLRIGPEVFTRLTRMQQHA